jgi:A/G-specific adenine glycosylase
MTSARADFATRIVAWHRKHGRRDLPWQTRDAYRVWLSEVMLQQTQVATARPYFERFVAAFPDVRALAAAPLERVLERWSGLGYYRRAHHLHAAARAIVERHGGEFPRERAAIEALPGIGRSTAAAIAAFAFGACAPILDGNVKRVLARHRGIAGFPGEPRVERALWDAAESLCPVGDIEAYTQGMMDLGATLCTRTEPRCDMCPVADDCVARIERRTGELPSPRPRKTVPQRATRVLVIEHARSILFERRPPTGVWSGLWSLPEAALDADVEAVLHARFGLESSSREALAPVTHAFTHYTLTMHPERVVVKRAIDRAAERAVVWLPREDAIGAALPAPIRRLVRSLDAPLLRD